MSGDIKSSRLLVDLTDLNARAPVPDDAELATAAAAAATYPGSGCEGCLCFLIRPPPVLGPAAAGGPGPTAVAAAGVGAESKPPSLADPCRTTAAAGCVLLLPLPVVMTCRPPSL